MLVVLPRESPRILLRALESLAATGPLWLSHVKCINCRRKLSRPSTWMRNILLCRRDPSVQYNAMAMAQARLQTAIYMSMRPNQYRI